LLRQVEQQLNEYADGRRLQFDIPFALDGTVFQQAVWRHLLTIPVGQTASYQSVASAVGHARAARAVGAAVSANPLAILVPCHRVIKSNGSIGGYAGGSWVKAVLLQLEHLNTSEHSS
jgi:methylated-DNA-[protein]-cysteine S-methyltransferase